MPIYTDQLSRTVDIPATPKRIISFVPSQTELLSDLGLDVEVVGITKFCIHPGKWFQEKERIGGTKNINIKKINALKPDLIIANKEENIKEQIEELAKQFSVWVSDVNNLADAYRMIESIGDITGRKKEAHELHAKIAASFAQLQTPHAGLQTAYLIWKDPYTTVGGDTFIHHMLQQAGFENVFATKQRYPEVTIDELRTSDCDLLFLSSEPYPFRSKHLDEMKNLLPGIKIFLVDGEMFSWYGSRLLKAPAYFRDLQKQTGFV